MRETKHILRMKFQALLIWAISLGMGVWLTVKDLETARYIALYLVILYLLYRFLLAVWDLLAEWI